MKKNLVLFASLAVVALSSCNTTPKEDYSWIKKGIDVASAQLKLTAEEIADSTKMPRSIWTGYDMNFLCQQLERDSLTFKDSLRTHPQAYKLGKRRLCGLLDWTSGFFPGELWFLYEYTQNNFWKKKAQQHTDILEKEKMNGSTHDMGFKVYCSFGNGYRLTQDEHYKEVLLQSARTLATRFKPAAGIIRSWDHSTAKWACPVIIDNMMNLELLFWATKESKDSTFYRIAVDHARTTMRYHFRPDFSSYHVIDYDTITGQVLKKNTHQGFADESAWSRGQAWALYGYTMCYRETRLPEFLEQAQNIEKYLFTHPNMPEDLIPYWDFDALGIPDEPRDVSAATVIASALYELSLYDPEKGERYRSNADKIIENLTKHYRATLKKDNGFLLLHSTGTKPTNTEVDVPIVYADYYFIEALMRKNKLEKTGKLF